MKPWKEATLTDYKMSGITAPETRALTGHTLERGEPVGETEAPV